MKASVIIPVHNAEAYLRECLEPLTSQVAHVSGEKARETAHASGEKVGGAEKLAEATRGQFPFAYEIICVEDGSVDGSRAIIEEFVACPGTASRVRLVSLEESHGPSAARNAGIDAAEGDFLLFADSDDIPAATFVCEPIQAAEAHNADIVIFSFERYFGKKGACFRQPRCWDDPLYEHTFSLEDTQCLTIDFASPSVWRTCWRRSFINEHGIRFPVELTSAEDLVFTYEALLSCKRILLLDRSLYRYRCDGGTTLTKTYRGPTGFRALCMVLDYAKQHNMPNDTTWRHLVNLIVSNVHYSLYSASSCDEYFEIYEEFERDWKAQIKPYEKDLIPHYADIFAKLEEMDAPNFLFFLCQSFRTAFDDVRLEKDALARQVDEQRQQIDALYQSRSWRLGNAIMDPIAKARDRMSHKDQGGQNR